VVFSFGCCKCSLMSISCCLVFQVVTFADVESIFCISQLLILCCHCGCSVISMAHGAACCQTHLPILFRQSSPAKDIRAQSMASETSPWCGPGELQDVVVRQVGWLPESNVQHWSMEATVVSNFRRRSCREHRKQPRLSSPIRQV